MNTLRWEDTETLLIDVKWIEKPALLEKYQPVSEVEEFFKQEDNFSVTAPEPELMVPLQNFKTKYHLPVKKVVYDQIRNRGDSTTFHMDSLMESQIMKFRWFRIGKTNLWPIISILDPNHKLVERHRLRGIKRFSFSYKVPVGESVFYLRISDENGAIEGVGGSFQFFHYLLENN